MKNERALVAFEKHAIRRYFDEKSGTWYFSVVDVVAALTDSSNPAVYWRVLKKRLKDEGGDETVTKCNGLKMPSADGKMRLTDMADTETLLRLIQSIPSPKAEPFKQWLAKVGYERIQDMSDPSRSLDRAREYWQKHGRSEKWIQQRMMGQETRNKLTDYWITRSRARRSSRSSPTSFIRNGAMFRSKSTNASRDSNSTTCATT